MKIDVNKLKDAPINIQFEEPIETFPLLLSMQDDKVCLFAGKVSGSITAVKEFDTIRVNGRVSVPIELICSRCIVDYPSFVDSSFMIFFRRELAAAKNSDLEVELSEMELLSTIYTTDEIDLTHEIEEQVAMEIPLKPLCSDVCKGLCHHCGTDLNVSTCSCESKVVSFAFTALKNFKIKNSSG